MEELRLQKNETCHDRGNTYRKFTDLIWTTDYKLIINVSLLL